MEAEQELQAAQERLLTKREELKATGNHGPSTMSFKGFKCRHDNDRGHCEICNSLEKEREEREKKVTLEYKSRAESEHLNNPGKFMKRYIPKKFIDRSLENFIGSSEIKKLCLSYVDGFDREKSMNAVYGNLKNNPGSLLFTGTTGSGKTHLAVAIIREIEKRMLLYNICFTTAPELLLEIRATFRPSEKSYNDFGRSEAQTESDVLNKYSECELLILDDLGAEKVSDFTIQSLYLIIDRRNRELRPTIVTTNLSLEEIEEKIDARMASRLADMKVIKLNMPDYRKKR